MKNLRKSFFLLLFSTAAMQVAAQTGPPPERGEKIKAFRVAIFTQHLNLTSEEAQGFWPIYNEFVDRRDNLQRELRNDRQLDSMNDNEVEEHIRKYFEIRTRELDLEKDMNQRLRKVLPARKIAKIHGAERMFRESLVKKLQDARSKSMERRQPPRGGK
jgi:hypothetical protein